MYRSHMSLPLLAILCLWTPSAFAENIQGEETGKIAATEKKTLSVAHMEISGTYAEGVSIPGLFGDVVETLPFGR